MARKAFISSDMAHDEKLFDVAQESSLAALIFPMLITYFDDWGRALFSPKRIKSQIFPNVAMVTVQVIEESLNLFAKNDLIEKYSDGTHDYIAIPPETWFKWQTHIRQEKRDKDNSKYPPCPSDSAHSVTNSAQLREGARSSARLSENLTPSPTPSLTPTSTEMRSNARARDIELEAANEDAQTSEQSDEAYIQPEPTEPDASPVASLAAYCHTHKIKHAPNLYICIEDHLAALCDEHPPVWVERALKITAGYGRKSISYTEAILHGWAADGGPPEEPENVTRGRGKRDGAHERVHNKSPAKDRGAESSGEFAGLNVYEWIPPPGYTEDG